MGTQELDCNDRYSGRLRTKVQSMTLQVILPRSERIVLAKVTTKNYCLTGLIDGDTDLIPVARCAGSPNDRGRVVIRCMNPTDQPVRLKAGMVVDTYTRVNDADVSEDRQCVSGSESRS